MVTASAVMVVPGPDISGQIAALRDSVMVLNRMLDLGRPEYVRMT
ncbi:hypothetical protein ACFQX4_20410 [Roseomonas sp. GCM10028921]